MLRVLCLLTLCVNGEGGVAFFKLVNVAQTPVETEITGQDYIQIITVQPGKSHLVAVRAGVYDCGLKKGDKKTCSIEAGQIIQLDLPWKGTKITQEKVEKAPDFLPKIGPKMALVEIKGLPEDASLWCNNQKMKTAVRWFTTPNTLVPGTTYQYVMRAEVIRDGKTYVDTKTFVVRPGRKTTVEFKLPLN